MARFKGEVAIVIGGGSGTGAKIARRLASEDAHLVIADLKSRADAMLPGAIDTPMLWENQNVRSGAEVIGKKDAGRPEDIAAAAAFPASDDAAFVIGARLALDGGRLAKL